MIVWELLGKLGWHADGKIKRGRQIVGYYYKLDRLSDIDLDRVREYWPDAERMVSQSEYAPEQRNPVVFVPSRAERKRIADKAKRAARKRIEQAGPLLPFRVKLYA